MHVISRLAAEMLLRTCDIPLHGQHFPPDTVVEFDNPNPTNDPLPSNATSKKLPATSCSAFDEGFLYRVENRT